MRLEHESAPFSAHNEDVAWFYRKLHGNSDRISALHLRGQYDTMTMLLLDSELPNISEFEICLEPIGDNRPREVVDIYNAIRAQADEICTRRTMRKVLLSNYIWTLEFHEIPPLTHLYLQNELDDWELTHEELLLILEQLAPTLQVLVLYDATPYEPMSALYPFRPPEMRIFMPVLHYIEVRPAPQNEFTDFSLLFLHSLRLPQEVTIAWDFTITNIGEGKWDALPSEDIMLRIINVIGLPLQEDCITVVSRTIWYDWEIITKGALEGFTDAMRNARLLAIPDHGIEYQEIKVILFKYSMVESLHLGFYDAILDILWDLEFPTREDGVVAFPKLVNLTIYTGDSNIMSKRRDRLTKRLRTMGLQPLHLSSNASMTRKRKHLGSTYLLTFVAGDMDKEVISSIQLF